MTTATDDQPFAPVADTPTLDIERFVDVLRRLDVLEPVDVALGIAGAGVPVLPVVPGSKAPMLERSHVSGCAACRRHELVAAKDHGATRDTDTIRAWFAAHPDAGVGMKDHPRLVRGDADFATGRDLIDARKRIGYGQPDGIADPLTAYTPGGQYRRRFLHLLPDGVPAPVAERRCSGCRGTAHRATSS